MINLSNREWMPEWGIPIWNAGTIAHAGPTTTEAIVISVGIICTAIVAVAVAVALLWMLSR